MEDKKKAPKWLLNLAKPKKEQEDDEKIGTPANIGGLPVNVVNQEEEAKLAAKGTARNLRVRVKDSPEPAVPSVIRQCGTCGEDCWSSKSAEIGPMAALPVICIQCLLAETEKEEQGFHNN